MKKMFFLFFLLFIGVSAYSQKFYAGYEYLPHNTIKVVNSYENNHIQHKIGSMNFIYGFNYDYKKFLASFTNNIYFDPNTVISYTPKQIEFNFEIKYKISNSFYTSIHHKCIHPIKTNNKSYSLEYGSTTKIGIYYNM